MLGIFIERREIKELDLCERTQPSSSYVKALSWFGEAC